MGYYQAQMEQAQDSTKGNRGSKDYWKNLQCSAYSRRKILLTAVAES